MMCAMETVLLRENEMSNKLSLNTLHSIHVESAMTNILTIYVAAYQVGAHSLWLGQ